MLFMILIYYIYFRNDIQIKKLYIRADQFRQFVWIIVNAAIQITVISKINLVYVYLY